MPTGETQIMQDIQTTGFAMLDLQLYLDSHPDDSVALQNYGILVKRMNALCHTYEGTYGPLNGFGDDSTVHRQGWVYQPWPWEFN